MKQFKPTLTAIFHIGRGGRFNNGGYKVCKAIKSNFDHLYWCQSENLTVEETGDLDVMNDTLSLDGEYNTYSWSTLDKISSTEIEDILLDLKPYEYEAFVLEGLNFYNNKESLNIWKLAKFLGNEVLNHIIEYYESVTIKELDNLFHEFNCETITENSDIDYFLESKDSEYYIEINGTYYFK